jgi:hypothetical protein
MRKGIPFVYYAFRLALAGGNRFALSVSSQIHWARRLVIENPREEHLRCFSVKINNRRGFLFCEYREDEGITCIQLYVYLVRPYRGSACAFPAFTAS